MRWPVQAPHAHARVLSIDAAAARSAPGVLAVLTADDVPGENDIGPARARRAAVPDRGLLRRPGRRVGDRRDGGAGRALAAGRGPGRVRGAAGDPLDRARHRRRQLPHRRRSAGTRRRRGRAARRRRIASRASSRIGGQEHFYLETNAALAYRDEDGGMLVHSSTQHPTETQEIVARVLGLPKHAVVVQCLRMGGAFGGKEVQANAWAAVAALAASRLQPARARPADAPAGHGADRQAPPVPGALPRRLRRPTARLRALAIAAVQRRRLVARPELPGARPRDVPHRQLLPRAAHGRGRPRLPDAPRLAHRLPRLRRPAGHARDRGDRRSRRAGARPAAARRPRAQLLSRGRRRRTTARWCGDPDRIARIWSELQAPAPLRGALGGGRRLQRRQPRTSSAAWRSRR